MGDSPPQAGNFWGFRRTKWHFQCVFDTIYSRLRSRRNGSRKKLSCGLEILEIGPNRTENVSALFWTPRAEFLASVVDFLQEWSFSMVFAKNIFLMKKYFSDLLLWPYIWSMMWSKWSQSMKIGKFLIRKKKSRKSRKSKFWNSFLTMIVHFYKPSGTILSVLTTDSTIRNVFFDL